MIEAFGAFLPELDVELSLLNIIQTWNKEASLLQRVDFELSVRVP